MAAQKPLAAASAILDLISSISMFLYKQEAFE